MARAGLSESAVVDLALQIVDDDGPDALTLAAIAGRAGVATPSLYKHVEGLADLRDLVSIRVMNDLSDAISDSVMGRSGDEALRALMTAYRTYAVANPHRYASMTQTPSEKTEEAGTRLVNILLAALRAYGLNGSAAIHAARTVRAAAHGFAVLESSGGFQLAEKLDESYALLVHMVISGLHSPEGSKR